MINLIANLCALDGSVHDCGTVYGIHGAESFLDAWPCHLEVERVEGHVIDDSLRKRALLQIEPGIDALTMRLEQVCHRAWCRLELLQTVVKTVGSGWCVVMLIDEVID